MLEENFKCGTFEILESLNIFLKIYDNLIQIQK